MRRRFAIDITKAASAASLHACLRKALPLPEEYGDNLDAWFDVLTERGANWTLVFRGKPPEGFREVCSAAVEATPGLVVRFVTPRGKRR